MADEFNEPVEETQEILPVESEPAAADISEDKPVEEKLADAAPIKEKKVKPPKPPKPPKQPKPPKTPKTPQEKAHTKKIIKKTILVIVTLLIIAGIAGAVSWYMFFRDTSVNVTATMVLRGEVKDLVNATGKVEANQMVPLYALQDDKVTDILVKEGDTVTSGQNIIKLETGGFVTSTTAGKVVSVAVKVNDKVAGLTTPYTTQTPVPAPTTPTTPGQTTTPTTPSTTTTTGVTKNPNPTTLATIANMDPTYVVANVDETDISKLKIGQKADMVLDSYPGKTIKGEVVEIGLVATVTTTGGTAFPVKIKTTEAKNVDLRIGMSADTEIVVETKEDALRVPVAAVTTDNGKDAVYIVKETKAEKTTIKIGLLSGEYYEVLAGITEGEEVVVKGVDLLKGQKTATVKVKRP